MDSVIIRNDIACFVFAIVSLLLGKSHRGLCRVLLELKVPVAACAIYF